MARLTPFAAVAAAFAIVVAGCGSAGATGPGGANGAATIVPSDAVAFVAASTDLNAADWHGLGQFALAALERQTKLDWSRDVGPIAGDEIDVALLADGKAVGFVQPSDEAKLAAFAKAHDCVVEKIGDWSAVAGEQATLDAVANAKSHLADNTLYLAAMGRLPGNALVRAYANGAQANALFQSIPGQLESRFIPAGAHYRQKPDTKGIHTAVGVGTREFKWFAAALTGSGSGVKVEAFAAQGDLTASQPPRLAVQPIAPYRSALVDEIPSGALAVLDFQVPTGAFELLPSLPAGLAKAFGPDLTTLPNELDALLGGETALYVRPALPTPEITLVTQPTDTAAASSTLDGLLNALPASSPLRALTLHRAVIGGQFVVSTTQGGIDAFRGGGPKLSADPTFLEARKQSGMPEETTGFAYVNARGALPLLALAGVKLPADLPQLGTVAVYGGREQGDSTLTAYLGLPGR